MWCARAESVAAVLRTGGGGGGAGAGRGEQLWRGARRQRCPATSHPRQERALAQAVIDRFSSAGAPLTLAGVDLMNDRGRPVVNEVEDVVGSRMLYQTSDIDIVSLFLDGLSDIAANAP